MNTLKTYELLYAFLSCIKRTFTILGAGVAIMASANVYAGCTYTIEQQWNNGFTAKIKITNTTGNAINSWNVNWGYAGDNRVTSSYNVTLTGANPYNAANISWNGNIAVGGNFEFGVQGTKGAAPAEIPAVTGAACAGGSTSVASSSIAPPSSSSASSRMSASSSSTGGVGAGVLFQDSFDSGAVNTQPAGWDNFIAWNFNGNNVPTASTYALIDSSKSFSGTKSVHFKGQITQLIKALPPGVRRLHIRAYVNMTKQLGSEPSDNHEHIMGLKKTPDANNEVRIGQIKGVLGTNEVPSDNIAPKMAQWGRGPIITPNAWHCVESAFYADTAYNEVYMWVDGALVHSITSANDWNNGSLPANWLSDKFNYVMFGFHSFSGNSTDVWMDDIVVSTQPIGCGVISTSSSSAPSSSVMSSSRSSSSPLPSSSSVAPSSSSRAPSSSSASSSSIIIIPGSSSRSSIASSVRSSSSSVAQTGLGNWDLSATDSYLNFVTTKNTHTIETQRFDVISGGMTDNGIATLIVDLTSVNTTNTTRDQRLRDLFFQTLTFPSANIRVVLSTNVLSTIAVGKSALVDISATLELHGVTGAITTKVMVQKLSNTRVLVQSVAPIIVKSSDYALDAGVEALRAAVGIASVSGTVPVDFTLVFNAR